MRAFRQRRRSHGRFADDWDRLREHAETDRERTEIDAIFQAHTEVDPAFQHDWTDQLLAPADDPGPDADIITL